MLHELHLRSLGVIAEASVSFAPGLNVVTGETGVGKTLLVTSLGLLTGARGAARLVAEGATEAVVQAVVSRPDVLPEGVEPQDDDELILVRRLSSDGRSRALAGGQLVPISALAEIGEGLIEVHGQGAGFALARPAAQLAAIDALAGNDDLLAAYRGALAVLRGLEREAEALRTDEAARAREVDVLAFQLAEIDRAELEAGEEDDLLAQIARLEHAERLAEVGAEVVSLAGPDGAAGELAQAHKELDGAARIDAAVAGLVVRLGDLAAEVSELAREIRAWSESMEANPSQLERLRERRALLASLKRKYGGSVDEILAFAEEARSRLSTLAASDERIGTIDAEIAAARAEVDALAGDLTGRRAEAAARLTELVRAELPSLALPKATFEVRHETAEPTESGADRVTFLFSASAGRTPDELGKVASGGELSRAMIAVTLALASVHHVGVLVFDEADAGVGGEAALELGRRLQRLAGSHQVLVVTHLPQIAAFADRHIAVEREGDDVVVRVLEDAERRQEISRMLAGLGSSDLAQAHAAELLELAAVAT